MGLESLGQKLRSASSGNVRLAVSLVFVTLALLLVAPMFNWAESSGTLGGLAAAAGRSLQTFFNFSGDVTFASRVGLLFLWAVAFFTFRRWSRGLRETWMLLMAEASTAHGQRRIWRALITHSYLVLLPILALTRSLWREPSQSFMELRWAESFLAGSAAVSWWRFGLAVDRVVPALLTVASLANLLGFVCMARNIATLKRLSRLPPSKDQPTIPEPAYGWALLGGLPGTLLARQIFAPEVRPRVSMLGVIHGVLYGFPLWIPLLMMWVEREALHTTLRDDEPATAVRATKIVSAVVGHGATAAVLAPRLQSADLHVFARAANGLCWLGPHARETVDDIFAALLSRQSLAERELLLETLQKVEPAWAEDEDASRFVPALLEHLSLRWMSNDEPDLNPMWGSRSLDAFARAKLTPPPMVAWKMVPIDETEVADLIRTLFRIDPDWMDSPAGQSTIQSLVEISEAEYAVHPFKRQAAAAVLLALKEVGRASRRRP